MIIFTKYSNDRRPELMIRTDIAEEGGVRTVIKAAADPRAAAHINGLAESYAGLGKLYAGTKFIPNRCTAGEGSCTFEYLQGVTFEEQMDALLDTPDELALAVRAYFDELLKAADTRFVPTEKYREVFGDIITSDDRAFSVSNIDMVFNNIIVRDGWNVIDYEWTFPFSVPVNFVIWRAYHYYVDVNMKRACLRGYDLLSAYHITESDIEAFDRMEKNFQAYVTGTKVPLRELYPDISPGYVVIGELWEAYREKNKTRLVTLFPQMNGTFSAENMITTFSEPLGIYKRTVRLGGAPRLRIDPTESAVIVHVNSITADGTILDLKKADLNGILLGDNDMIFTQEDPCFILNDIPEGAESVAIDMVVRPLGEEFFAAWQKLGSRVKDAEADRNALIRKVEEQDARIAEMRRSRLLVNDVFRGKSRAIRDLGSTKAMRLYRRMRSGIRRSDPIGNVLPRLDGEESGILCNIDNVTAHDRYLLVKGWICDKVFENENLYVSDGSGKEIECSILRTQRNDVAGHLKIDRERRPGFEVRIRYSRITKLPLILRIENPRGYIEMPVPGVEETDITKGRSGEITYTATDTQPMEYDDYASRHRALHSELKSQRKERFPYAPVVSFCIPVYNVSTRNLRKMIESLLSQSYRGTEICIADGSSGSETEEFIRENYGSETRIVYIKREPDPVTAQNLTEAIRISSGDVIVPADANDLADPRTAYEIVRIMNLEGADVVYTDEDALTPDGHTMLFPKFKPDFSPDYLRSMNYIGSFFAVKRSLAEEAGMPDPAYGDAYMYNFVLRCTEKAEKVSHAAMALCHRRINPAREVENRDSIETFYDCEMRAVNDHLSRVGIVGQCERTYVKGGYHVKAEVKNRPLVSVIIPSKDHMGTLNRAIDSIMGKTSYGNYEIIIVENGSSEEQTFLYYERIQLRYPNVRVITWTKPFNYSAINNFGVREARGEYLLFLNNDVEVITPDWMGEMLSVCQREECGACGAKLLFPDNTIQHVGVVIGMGGAAGHMFSGAPADEVHYEGRSDLTQNVSAATAACLMVKRSVFEKVGGFDEELQVAFNDVDLCLKIREAGYLVAVNASAQLYHYESLTRGSDKARDDREKHERFLKESGVIRSRWKNYFKEGDPYFNRNLDATRGDFAFEGEYPARDNQEEE